jgi:chitodextrinase
MHYPWMLSGRARGALLVTLVLGLCAVFAASAGVAGATVPAPPSGFTTMFSDDFSGAAGTGVSTSNWLYDTGHCYPGCPAGNWGTGEVENMTTSTANVFQDGAGHLDIKPIRDASGNWTSGRIETQRTDFDPGAGGVLIMQGSLQQPNVSGAAAAGYWPAFWSLGAPFRGVYTNWPQAGEIDIMEDINGLSSVFGTLHCGSSPGGPCNETTGLGSGQRACSGCQTGFHTYAVQVDRSVSPEQIRFYLDGANYFTVNSGQVDATTWNNAVHHGFFMILNVAMGGSFPGAFGGGPTASTASGVPMVVDYVAVYKKAAGGGDTTAPSTPANLTSPSHTSSSVSLSWAASTDNVGVTGYQIFRNGVQVGTSTSTSFTNTGLAASTSYSFTVKARDAAGNVSAASNAVSVTTSAASGDTTPPSTPTNLASPSHTSSSVSLSWTGSTDNVGVTGYQIFRNGVQVATSSTTSYTNTGLAASTSYSFTVKATDAAGNVSAASNTISVTTSAGSGGTATPTLFVRSGSLLSATAGAGATTVSIPSAGGANHDGTPTNAATFTATGLSGSYASGATAFSLYVDSGACVGNAVQARVSYDFNGDGAYDRTETYNYFATNDLAGLETYSQAQGLKSSTGSLGSFTAGAGRVQLQVWSAIGNCASTVRVDATSAQGSQSKVVTPQT